MSAVVWRAYAYLPEHTGAYAGSGDRAWGSNAVAGTPMNERHTLVLNHILNRALGGMDGKLTNAKWVAIGN